MIILFFSSVISFPCAPAENPIGSQVETTVTCTFENGSMIAVHIQMLVNRIDNIFDMSYDRQMIESNASVDPEVMGAIKLQLRELEKNQLEMAFDRADLIATNMKPTYSTPYFVDDFQVNLTTAFFRYNGSLDITNYINGVLDMGANVSYHFRLQAEDGWNTTYVFVLPVTMTLAYANTPETNPESNTVSWMVWNWNGGDTGRDAMLSIRSKNPTTLPAGSEDINLEFTLDTQSVNSVSFTNSIIAKTISIYKYGILPEFVTGLNFIPADGVRLFIDSGLFSWSALFENTIQPIERLSTPIIENSTFAQPLSYSFSWDKESTTNCSTPYNITHMDTFPALRANYQDPNVNLQICQLPARAFFGLINAGANAAINAEDMNFGPGLSHIPYPYTIVLQLPANITLNSHNTYIWNMTTPLNGSFYSTVKPTPPYTNEHTETRVEIEISKMDLNIPSIFTGKTELTAATRLTEENLLYVIQRPPQLPLPTNVDLLFLNSDALRLCLEEQVFSDSQTSVFLAEKTEMFQQRLSTIFHGLPVKGMLDRKVFLNSLGWDGDISTMDDVQPVIISNTANEAVTIKFNVSLWPAGLSLTPQNYTFQGIGNQTVTYRLIFPQGVTVNASDTSGRSIARGKTSKGNDYVEVSFDPESSLQSTVLTCTLSISPVYVIWIFLPCILVFVLLIVLVVIILLIRKKRGGLRRGKRKLFEPEDDEPVSYGGESYYVPPPPSSKKKR